MSGERGFALLTVLILLGVGGVLLVPTLRYTSSALKTVFISRELVQVQYSLDAFTQRALWELQYDDSFQDCGVGSDTTTFDGIPESFAGCVALWGSWTLTTQTTTSFNETHIDKINNQDVSLTVEVPGGLTAPSEPTILESGANCLNNEVTRLPTWANVGESVEYTIHLTNCRTSGPKKDLRRLVLLLDPAFIYATSTSAGSIFLTGSPGNFPDQTSKEPEVNRCTGVVDDPVPGCKTVVDSLHLAWPSATGVFRKSEDTEVQIAPQETLILTFEASASNCAVYTCWGVFYVDVTPCFFAVSASSCDTDISADPVKKVAPVVVGMFNLKGKGKGNAFGGSTGGGKLVSKGP